MDSQLANTLEVLCLRMDELLGEPSSTNLEALYEEAQRLEAQSQTSRSSSLKEAAFGFNVFLSTFVNGTQLPDNRQLDKLRLLLDDIKRHHDEPTLPTDASRVLLYFGDPGLLPFGMQELCAERGLNLMLIDDLSLLDHSMAHEIAPTLLFDARRLDKLRAMLHEYDRATALARLATISQELEPETRNALAHFGVEHFFVTPVVASELADKLFPSRGAGGTASLPGTDEERPARIIIVDDDETQADFAAAILANAGMDTLAISDPGEVLALAGEFHPDMILIDLYMPGISGEELTALLRRRAEFADIPLIYLSGELEKERQESALSVGADGFLEKPIRPKRLIKTVEERLRAPRQNRQAAPVETQDAMATDDQPLARLMKLARRHRERPTPLASVALHFVLAGDSTRNEVMLRSLIERINARLGNRGRLEVTGPHTLIGLLHGPNLKKVMLTANNLHGRLAATLGPTPRSSASPVLCSGLSLLGEPIEARAWKRAAQACANSDGRQCALDKHTRRHLTEEQFKALHRRLRLDEALELRRRPLNDAIGGETLAHVVYPRLPEIAEKRWAEIGIVRAPMAEDVRLRLDRKLLEAGLEQICLSGQRGECMRLLVPQSGQALKENGQIEWLRNLLRARQQTGIGLVCLFPIKEISRDLADSRARLEELASLGITASAFDVGLQPTAFRIAEHLKLEHLILSPKALQTDIADIQSFFDLERNGRTALVLPYSGNAVALRRLVVADAYLGDEQPGLS